MRYFVPALLLLLFLILPLSVGCSRQRSEESTPIEQSDDTETESPANDADNP